MFKITPLLHVNAVFRKKSYFDSILFVSLQLTKRKSIFMPYVRGYEEDGFLKQLGITRQSLEILSADKAIPQKNF